MRGWSIARQLFLGSLLFVTVITAVVVTLAFLDSRDRAYAQATQNTTAIATTIADSPLLLEAAKSSDPSALLQPYALSVIAGTKVDFVTIMAPDRTRWTHPDPSQIGKPYIGSVDQALAGKTFTEITAGTLGPSVRSIVPVKDSAGKVQAMVAVGVTVSTVEITLNARIPVIIGLGLGLLAVGGLVSWLLGRYLRRVTLGWGPKRLGQLFSYYESVLHSVRDGLVLVDRSGELVMYNDQAADLLGIPRPSDNTEPPALATLEIPASLKDLLASGRSVRDEIHLTEERLLVVSQDPAVLPGGRLAEGTVTTLQDHTDLRRLGDELRSTRTFTDALRAQTHEHANRMHTVVSLLELGRTNQALAFATEDLSLSQHLVDEVIDAEKEPVLAALLMGKLAQASERAIELEVSWDESVSLESISPHDVLTIVGNLLDNAMDAVALNEGPESSRLIRLELRKENTEALLKVSDNGPGIGLADTSVIFQRGFSTKEADETGRGIGLALVRQSVQRLGGQLTVTSEESGTVFSVRLPLRIEGGKA
ncbi:sensor histidine kinase regulating citrate/malate metabolism [Psychromicrobium silvestre]|uniref:histidine kinase n=1 Tax=Psychromicrobium silvestre TaxID=1645614 RepID=A0A7Y9LQR5_9MICC|nr:sensor histidine kinase [Psychromicrobium silvestre]NYE93853.1 sensor histidine kinase regulating citrate/malate metabolism [Psychromicrobium silvestre]